MRPLRWWHLLAALPLPAALLFVVAGCSQSPFSRPYAVYGQTSPDTLEGQCERASYDDPAVKDELARAAGSVNYAQEVWLKRVDAVRRQAIQRCMLQRGGNLGGGGVELPVR